MAAFRKYIYALAIVALIAGLTVPVSAQTTPLQCTANAGSPPFVRSQGLAELVGDIIIDCTGGTTTAGGAQVPAQNISITLNTNVTSKLTATTTTAGLTANMSEALLIVDEPSSAANPTRPLLNCGQNGADNGPQGPGVCSLISTGNAAQAYDGTVGSTSFNATAGTNRPNVFQGRQAVGQSTQNGQQIVFLSVPFEAPSTNGGTRRFRITNIRANANSLGGSANAFSVQIQAQISITGIALANPIQTVGLIQNGLTVTNFGAKLNYLQCDNGTNGSNIFGTGIPQVLAAGGAPTNTISTSNSTGSGYTHGLRFTEGFAYSFKPRNISEQLANTGFGSGLTGATAPTTYPQYGGGINRTGTAAVGGTTADFNQNYVGGSYFTETGFTHQAAATAVNPGTNPPVGVGSVAITPGTTTFTTGSTGIANAGTVSAGTRLAMQIASIPNGAYALTPSVVYFYRVGAITAGSTSLQASSSFTNGTATGVSILVTGTDSAGNGGTFAAPTITAGTNAVANTLVAVPSNGLVVYEVLASDPFSVEATDIAIVLSYAPAVSSNLPAPGVIATAVGGFAPFYTSSAAGAAALITSFPLPRFAQSFGTASTSSNVFAIVKCSCNLLFPYVVSTGAGGYDTGIAIANTTSDPAGGSVLASTTGFTGNIAPQAGGVQFWYYGTTSTGGAAPASQCTNRTTPGVCPPTPDAVPTGQVLTYILSQGGQVANTTTALLDNRAKDFTGYVIAQTQFQACHAYAYISATLAGPLSPGISEGYLGLILDTGNTAIGARTSAASEALNN